MVRNILIGVQSTEADSGRRSSWGQPPPHVGHSSAMYTGDGTTIWNRLATSTGTAGSGAPSDVGAGCSTFGMQIRWTVVLFNRSRASWTVGSMKQGAQRLTSGTTSTRRYVLPLVSLPRGKPHDEQCT